MSELIRTELGDAGVLTATIDMPDRSMNVFSAALMHALETLLNRVDTSAEIASVVLTSGKSSFLAGADLSMVKGFADSAHTATMEQMFALCGRLGRLFVRIEASAKPWVAAVNGTALGGGLELAMACRVRLVSDAPRTKLGVPEVRWGLLPGAGGTQRLPRLVGFKPAMALLLTGNSLNADDAVSAGIFEAKVAAGDLLSTAQARARALQGQPYDAARKFRNFSQSDVPPYSLATARQIAHDNGVADSDLDLYPAYLAIVYSVLLGCGMPLHQASDVEMRQFIKLMFDPVAGNMMRTLFLNRQRADKALRPLDGLHIKHVGTGVFSQANACWTEVLAKSKIPHTPDAALPADTLELVDNHGVKFKVRATSLQDVIGQNKTPGPAVVLSAAGPYGRVLEIVDADDAGVSMLAALAIGLFALPYRTFGPTSVLMELARVQPAMTDDHLQSQSVTALENFALGHIADPELLDVAACTANVSPAWSGGPFTWALQHKESLAEKLPHDLAKSWPSLLVQLEKAYA